MPYIMEVRYAVKDSGGFGDFYIPDENHGNLSGITKDYYTAKKWLEEAKMKKPENKWVIVNWLD